MWPGCRWASEALYQKQVQEIPVAVVARGLGEEGGPCLLGRLLHAGKHRDLCRGGSNISGMMQAWRSGDYGKTPASF